MNDDTFRPAAADAEALSAYLLGELSDADAAALEQRLDRDPDLRARLDALAGALVALGGHDDVDVPAGFEDRLDARLASERAATAPADLTAHRSRRDRSKMWLGIGAAAAVIAVGSVLAGSMLQSMGGLDTAAEESAGSAGSESADAAADGTAERDGSGPRAPVILDTKVAIDDEAALRQRYEGVPEAQGLIGVPVGDARVLQNRFTNAVARRSKARALYSDRDAVAADPPSAAAGAAAAPEAAAGDDAGGEEEPAAGEPAGDSEPAPAAPPPEPAPLRKRAGRDDPCLAAIIAEARGPIVPVRVESVRYEGRRAVAYVFVTATPGATELDRTEVWVVRPDTCATLIFQQY